MDDPKRTLEEIRKDRALLAGACQEGLALMIRSSYIPILPSVLVKEGILPDKWFEEVQKVSGVLAADLVRVTGLDPEEGKRALEGKRWPCTGGGEAGGRLKEIVEWERVLEEGRKNPGLLQELGVAWYLWSIVEDWEFFELFPELEKVAEGVREFVEKLNRIKTEREGGEELSVVGWKDVFRVPV